jgi:hypothetical protein
MFCIARCVQSILAAGPKAIVLAGALGAGLMTVVQFGIKPFYPRL